MAWAELTDVRCYYEVIGSGEPILLVPGLASTCRVWDPIVPELAEHFSLILPDNRDVGQSVGRRHPRTMHDFAADLIELMDHLQIDRAHVVGISFGGILAQFVAHYHPSRVNRLVLMSCAHRFGPYLRQMAKLIRDATFRLAWSVSSRMMELLGSGPMYIDENPGIIEERIREKAKPGVSKGAVLRQLKCLSTSESVAPDYHIASPTMVIAGQYDGLIPSCFAKAMAEQIPGSEFHLLPDAVHNPMEEVPQEVVDLILEFFTRRTDGMTERSIVSNAYDPEKANESRSRFVVLNGLI